MKKILWAASLMGLCCAVLFSISLLLLLLNYSIESVPKLNGKPITFKTLAIATTLTVTLSLYWWYKVKKKWNSFLD